MKAPERSMADTRHSGPVPAGTSFKARLFQGPFPWARALGVPVVVTMLVFLDAGGLMLFVVGVIFLAAGAYRLAQGIWTIGTHPSRARRAVGARKAVSGSLTIAGICAAFVVFNASFDRAEETGRLLAGRLQAACTAGARCPGSLEAAGWTASTAGWVYRFPLIYARDDSGDGFSLWVRAGIDEGTMFFGGRDRAVESCSRMQFEVDRCEEALDRTL